jgi:magnesium chelatase family protein
MKVHSFIRQGPDLLPVEVELSLMPGLPQISFLGLPDAAMRESALRIRSALREQGFQLPQAHQVLVHLKPTHLRKSSRGLDLAVASALIWETGQLEKPSWLERKPYFYGELSLKGEVVPPDDLGDIETAEGDLLITGDGADLPLGPALVMSSLRDLASPDLLQREGVAIQGERPRLSTESFPREAARLLEVIAAGEHATLIAGAPGSGKSTLVEAVAALLDEPDPRTFRTSRRLARLFGREVSWRPVVQPHHTITPLAMIGGGLNPWPGEITRAHGGVLIMDELLEFHAEIQESLREPLESGSISIARGGHVRTFPASLLLLATTNLCPCGEFTPRRENTFCRCPRAVRARALQRLTGPFVDRFAIFALTDRWADERERIPTSEIRTRVEEAIWFRKERRGQLVPNGKLSESMLESQLGSTEKRSMFPEGLRSGRRRLAIMRVARTLADLRGSELISSRDLEEAAELSWRTHERLQAWRE